MWNHYKNYSILRKEATEHKEVFNFILLPALIIKNCLPLPLKLTLSQVMMSGEGDNSAKASQRGSSRSSSLQGAMSSFTDGANAVS